MKRILCVLTLMLGISVASLYGQEICNNGIDDDKDGFIDCFDGKCATSTLCTGGYVGNDVLCEAKPSAFPKFSMTLESASPAGTSNHLGRVVVGDVDRDGTPEMITTATESKKIFILNGENTSGVNTIQKQLTVSYQPAYEDILIANLNNDNCAEIFVLGKDWKVYAYDCNLVAIWSLQLPGDPGMMGLADFNGDGKVELYARNAIYNAHTGAVIVAPVTATWTNFNGGPVAVDILNDATKSAHLLTDAIKDDNLELVCGGVIYSVNIAAGTITSEKTIPNYGKKVASDATSIADYNNDGSLDVIASGKWTSNTPDIGNTTDKDNTTVFFWDVKNNITKTYSDPISTPFTIQSCPNPTTGTYYKDGWQSGTGRINIADIDGDGKLNAVYVSGKFLYALKDDWTYLWKITVNEETSGNTGCTLFDFNGDGSSEIIYRDEKYVYIIDGKAGKISDQKPCVSRTNREYPVVADVDGDGNTELCVTCRTLDFIQNGNITDPNDPAYNVKDKDNFCNAAFQYGQVRVFRSGGEPWVPARSVWNQHGYFNVNVNDDLTIPSIQQKHHLVFSTNVCTVGANRPLNSFLNQSPFLNSRGCPKYASPDLAYVDNSLSVKSPTCPDGDFTISFKIKNQGDLTLTGIVPITFYSGNPKAAGAIKLNTLDVTLSAFKTGNEQAIVNATVNGPGSAFVLYIVLNDNGTTVPTPIVLPNTNFVECNYDNNILSAPIKPLPVDLSALKVQDNLKCSPGTTADNGAVRAFVLKNSIENTTDFNFYWSIGTTAKPVASADYTGPVWTARPAGTYTVYAIHNTANCSSDTAKVDIVDVNRTVDANIIMVHAYDHCSPANGALRVVVNDTDGDGVGENANSFTYTWYEGNDIFTAPLIGINDTITGLAPLSYTVLVKDKVTGCQTIESFTIPDQTIIPVATATAVEATCYDPASGSVSASVTGATAGYTFKWYIGAAPKPTTDFTGPVYSNRPVGKYTVVATTNASKCASSPVTVEVVETTAPIVSATVLSNQTSCDPAQPTGSASANVAGSTSGYNFEWFKGQNTLASNLAASTSTATVLTNAIYTVKATSIATGCFDTEEVLIDFAVVTPSVSISSTTNPTRCDVPNGSITMAVSVDTPADYTFSWYLGSAVKVTPDFTQTTETLTGLEPGQYTVKAVNNTRHCEAAAVTVTIINASPVTTVNTVLLLKPSTCNDSNGAITVGASAVGNTSGFDFEWRSGQAPYADPAMTGASNTATTTSVTGLTTGAYTLITTNRDNGCTSTHLYELPFDNAQEVNFVSKTDIASCFPGTDGSITVKLVKTTIGYVESDYQIDVFKGTNDLGAAATPFQSITPVNGVLNYTLASPLQPGSYTFVAVSTNPAKNTFQCRSVPVTVELLMSTQPPVFTALTMTNNMNCVGSAGAGTISLSITSPSTSPSDYTFDWYEGTDASAPVLGTGTSGVEAGINGETIQNLPAGKYTVVITRTASGSVGCSASATYQIFDDLPTVSIAKADILVADINRCDMMSAGSVTVNLVSENGTKFPSANYDFAWFNDSPSGPQLIAGATTSSLINQPAGKYYVQPTNKISNCSTGELSEINIQDETSNTVAVGLLSFVTPTECLKPANVPGEFEVEGSGTSASGYTYNWYAGPTTADPALSIANVGGVNGELAKDLVSGTYTIEVVNNTTQCKITDTYTLPADKRPVTLATSTEPLTVCFAAPLDGTVFATVTSGSKNEYAYNWYIGSVKASADFTSTANSTVGNLSPGNYIVIATDNLNAACFVSDTTTVHDERVNPVATALPLNPLTICDPARPDGVAAATVGGDFINYTFDWFNGPTPAGTSFYTGSQASNLSANTYSVIATSVITGCSDTTNVKIEIKQATIPFPQIEIISLVTSCVEGNGSLTASVNGNTSDYIFDWYVGSQQKTSPDFTGEIYDELSVGKYGVTATSRTTGCVSVLVTEDIKEELVYPEFNYTTVASMCKRDATESGTGLAAVFVTNAVNIGSIEWNVQGSIVTGPILSDIEAGIYPVTVTTVLGCATTKEIEIKTEIHPYNGISRNSDGQNDLFFINCIESFPSNSVKIFNRAGTLVYEADGYDNNGVYFDGKSNKGLSLMGNSLPGGTYFFIIDKHDGTKPIAGYLELVN